MSFTETAYAKINLALHVRRLRGDGYHDIETIFAFADFGDGLTALPADTISLTISGAFGVGLPVGRHNLVVRAAEALAQRCDVKRGAAITLDKRLPVAAGIGGGSADAAASLRLLDRLWRIDAGEDVLADIARGLGADVPACVHSRTARGEGVGERLRRLDDTGLAGLPLLLVNPRVAVATGPVFGGWDGIDRGGLTDAPPLAAAAAGRNDLESPAIALCPVIADVLYALRRQNPLFVRMSGSGASCFALFDADEAAIAAQQAIGTAHPAWWCARGKLR